MKGYFTYAELDGLVFLSRYVG